MMKKNLIYKNSQSLKEDIGQSQLLEDPEVLDLSLKKSNTVNFDDGKMFGDIKEFLNQERTKTIEAVIKESEVTDNNDKTEVSLDISAELIAKFSRHDSAYHINVIGDDECSVVAPRDINTSDSKNPEQLISSVIFPGITKKKFNENMPTASTNIPFDNISDVSASFPTEFMPEYFKVCAIPLDLSKPKKVLVETESSIKPQNFNPNTLKERGNQIQLQMQRREDVKMKIYQSLKT